MLLLVSEPLEIDRYEYVGVVVTGIGRPNVEWKRREAEGGNTRRKQVEVKAI